VSRALILFPKFSPQRSGRGGEAALGSQGFASAGNRKYSPGLLFSFRPLSLSSAVPRHVIPL
jgi:hypothetical protein